MKDLQVLGNGKSYKFTDAEGNETFSDIQYNAEGIAQEGTPLNSENLLSDDTAQQLGLQGDNAVPDHAFDKLNQMMQELQNFYIIEMGNSNGWRYKKYSNGTFDAVLYASINNTFTPLSTIGTTTTRRYYTYQDDSFYFPALPAGFNISTANASINAFGGYPSTVTAIEMTIRYISLVRLGLGAIGVQATSAVWKSTNTRVTISVSGTWDVQPDLNKVYVNAPLTSRPSGEWSVAGNTTFNADGLSFGSLSPSDVEANRVINRITTTVAPADDKRDLFIDFIAKNKNTTLATYFMIISFNGEEEISALRYMTSSSGDTRLTILPQSGPVGEVRLDDEDEVSIKISDTAINVYVNGFNELVMTNQTIVVSQVLKMYGGSPQSAAVNLASILNLKIYNKPKS